LISDLKWPFEAMLFVLPEDFMKEYVGFRVPFIQVAKIRQGTHIGPQYSLGMEPSPDIDNDHDKIGVAWNVVIKNLPVDYSSSYNLSASVSKMIHPTSFCNVGFEILRDRDSKSLAAYTHLSDEVEIGINARINSLVIKLMMVMTARAELIETGQVVRKARKVGTAREKPEIWSPNVIGWKYRSPVRGEKGESTGVKLRMHRRRGYTRLQHYGPQNSKTKLKWIEPYWVNVDSEEGEK